MDCVADGATGACMTDSNSSISLGYISTGLQITESDAVILEYTGETQGSVVRYCLTVVADIQAGSLLVYFYRYVPKVPFIV